MALNSFSPNTKIESSKVNENFTNLANGTEILEGAITDAKRSPLKYITVKRASTTQSLERNVTERINFDSAENNDYGWWSSSSNPDRVTPDEAGLYYATFHAGWSNGNGSLRLAQLYLYDSTDSFKDGVAGRHTVDAFSTSYEHAYTISGLFVLEVGDYFICNMFHNSSNNETTATGNERPRLSVIKLGNV